MIFAIRPEPGLQSTLQLARDMNMAIIGMPLFDVAPIAWDAPDPAQFNALLLGSANALRHGGATLEAFNILPVYAVGEATAQYAQEAGFTVAQTGAGGLQSLLDGAVDGTHFLRLAGAENVSLNVPKGITATTRIVYELRALPITGSDEVSLRAADPLVLLHSAAAARHFASECDRRGLDKSRISLACIGPRVVKAAGDGWAACRAAPQPDDIGVLALARDMCH